MPGLFPHPSAAAENFSVGDQVKWFITEQAISPYVGVVTEVIPAIQKVWVDFPVGGCQQRSPEELILVTKFVGEAPVTEDTGYSSYDKAVSNKNYGKLGEKAASMAQRLVMKKIGASEKVSNHMKMASRISQKFATEVVEKLSQDVLKCIDQKMTDIQIYQRLYPQYEKSCSDGFMRKAIERIYKESAKVPPEDWYKKNIDVKDPRRTREVLIPGKKPNVYGEKKI